MYIKLLVYEVNVRDRTKVGGYQNLQNSLEKLISEVIKRVVLYEFLK